MEVRITLTANRKAIKKQLNVNFEMADKEQVFFANRTIGTDCSDGRVSGYFPGYPTDWSLHGHNKPPPHPVGKGVNAYMGDTAVTDFDPITGLVACYNKGPLVIPPCYDVSSGNLLTVGSQSISDNPFVTEYGTPGYDGFYARRYGFGGLKDGYNYTIGRDLQVSCGTSQTGTGMGRCPLIDPHHNEGVTAIAYFDPFTGISMCSHPNVLVPSHAEACDGDNRYALIGIRGSKPHCGTHNPGSIPCIPNTGTFPGLGIGAFVCSTEIYGQGVGAIQCESQACGQYPCSATQAIGGFNSTGAVSSCVDGAPTQTGVPTGFPGPKGQKGDDGSYLNKAGNPGPRGQDIDCSQIKNLPSGWTCTSC